MAQAEGEQVRRINRAKGDGARFQARLAEYQKAPEVTRRRLYLETLREILPTVGQMYVFDADQPVSSCRFST